MFSAIPQPHGTSYPTGTLPCSDGEPCPCPDPCVPGAGGVEILVVDLVADMAATASYAALKQFTVKGLSSVGDGFGGIWYVEPEDTTSVADGYYVVELAGGLGRSFKI